MRWLRCWPPRVGTTFRDIALGVTRNRNASHLDPGGRGPKGDIVGIVRRQATVAHGARNAESAKDLHSAGADVIATDVGWLTSRAHLGERHADAPSAEIHCQCKPDWTTPDDQDLRVDATRHATWLSSIRAPGHICTGDSYNCWPSRIAGRAGSRNFWPRNAQIGSRRVLLP